MKHLRTNYDPKPIPDRRFDWTEVTDNYDGAEDSSNRNQIGYGLTEREAIADLQEQLDDNDVIEWEEWLRTVGT